MLDVTPQQIVDELDGGLIKVMDPVFDIQMKSLRSYCSGKKDRLCSKRRHCTMKACNRAHTKEECMDGFYDAMVNVNSVMNEEVNLNRNHSRILNSLQKSMRKNNNNVQQQHHRNYYNGGDNNTEIKNKWRRNGR